ncbi:AAA family ATPase [Streptomyces sp. NPDC050287]|uniref:AAA family ATPase n=1 Tax=Streptomyces sp. NPDC050287 TaxID=3365608 RepID=UPI0037B41A37
MGGGGGAGGEPAAPVPAGRDAQFAVIATALAGIRSTGRTVVLRGDPGMGKTALLKAAEAAARRAGLRVLRMTGAEAERGLPFAALHQVLWPLLDDTHALPPAQRSALESALGVREGTPPAGFAVAGAALDLLARAAARRPVVVLLDDLQWADPSSAAVFAYLQRRLTPLPVVAIGAARHAVAVGDRGPLAGRRGTVGLPGRVIDLEPLDERQAERLLRTLHPWLPELARRRVLRAAGGNPLALHELPAQLRRTAPDHAAFQTGQESAGVPGLFGTGQESAGVPGLFDAGQETTAIPGLFDAAQETTAIPGLFDELPLGERLGRLYEDRLRALPDGTRHLLLVAALGGPYAQQAAVLRDMTDRPWQELRQDVEVSGLAHLDPAGKRFVFRHPLVRASLVHIATPAERRAAHRQLADALPQRSPQRITHLAAAAVGTDAGLARLLHAEADSMAAQGGDAEAAGMMARAAALSPEAADRTRRLVAAALLAARGGRLRPAAGLVAEAETEARPGRPEPGAAYAFVVAYTRLQLDGDPTPSIELLPHALELLESPAGREERAGLLEPMLLLLVLVAVHTGDERAWAAAERHAAQASEAAVLCLQAWSAAPPRTEHDVPSRLREAVAALPVDRETAGTWLLLWAAAAVDALGDILRSPFAGRPAHGTQAFIDSLRAHDDFLHGRWDECLTASRRGAETSGAHGHLFNEMLHLQNAGQVLAARGDRAGLSALESTLGTTARERGLRLVTERLRGLWVLCALGHGQADDAWHHARTLAPPGALPPRAPWLHLSLVDWVQAAVDSGRRTQARRHLDAVRAAGIARVSAHHTFLVAVAEALAAEDDEAEQRYEAAYALPGAENWPFPLARAHLAHAAWLRLHDRHGPAATHARAALSAFTRLGATPWAEQASRELGGKDAYAAGTAHPLLSAQELRIAELAAHGLTNRQIGERLGLSRRTIGAHLYKIFPKLGITTRAGVARALEETRGVVGNPPGFSRSAGPGPEPPVR